MPARVVGGRTAAAPARTMTPEAAAAKAAFEHHTASLNAKMGVEEATHQIASLRKKNGDNWQKTLAELKALDESTPAGRV